MTKPSPLDEYPIHQTALPIRHSATTDRNFYDRCYFNAHDLTGDVFLVTGLGLYPALGVVDAYACVRLGDQQHCVQFSDALEERTLDARVGGYSVEVVEPLEQIRVRCDGDGHGLGFDLTWQGSFPAVMEEPQSIRVASRTILDTSRFAQLGTWTGSLRVGDRNFEVTPDRWLGSRDRSWGTRPVGETEPPGRDAAEPTQDGFWWLYVPIRFDDFAVVLMAQERPDGYRTLNDAVRVWPNGRVEQLGWPRVEIDYRSGTRYPERARIHLTDVGGNPLLMEVETFNSVVLHIGAGYGAGYGADREWGHGVWKGRNWSNDVVYDMTDPSIARRTPFGAVDYVARATLDGAEGWGMFEHATVGRHEPSGFADVRAVAP